MDYYFDIYGWYSPEPIPGRSTREFPPSFPEKIVGELYPNFSGLDWIMLPYAYRETPVIQYPVSPQKSKLTKYQFISRLTTAERMAIYSSEETNPMIKMWLEMFRICEEIEPDNPDTIEGVRMLEALGFIGAGRAEQILHPHL